MAGAPSEEAVMERLDAGHTIDDEVEEVTLLRIPLCVPRRISVSLHRIRERLC
jgi:hypothetical protein